MSNDNKNNHDSHEKHTKKPLAKDALNKSGGGQKNGLGIGGVGGPLLGPVKGPVERGTF